MEHIFSITKLNAFIKRTLDREYVLKNVYVVGTIVNAKHHSNGHFYFTLKDEESAIDVTLWKSTAIQKGLVKQIENGLLVTMKASINFYSKTGRLHLICQDMQVGEKSSIQLEFEALKKELSALGYFDDEHKKPLPTMPTCIGIVTSQSGAVLHDILHVSKQRNPLIPFKLFAVPVQGDKAAISIAKGIQRADKDKAIELIIVGRGGGTPEDLWCFNDRHVVEAIYECKTPIISAVGHETDYTLCDFAADVRAATPSHAAEMSVYPLRSLQEQLDTKEMYLHNHIGNVLSEKKRQLSAIFNRKLGIPALTSIHQEQKRLQNYKSTLIQLVTTEVDSKKNQLFTIGKQLELLNPLHVMLKGYSRVESQHHVITSVDTISVGDSINITLCDGTVQTRVEGIKRYDNNN